MEKLFHTIYNADTKETITREYTPEEYAEAERMRAEAEALDNV